MNLTRLIILAIVIIFIWAGFLIFLVNYGEEVRSDPCSVCAERLQEDITCFLGANKKVFYASGKIEVIQSESSRSLQSDQGQP